ncbi:MAG: SAM-dependent methyltransferase [Acidobacteria bacterium]|nr:SAM-dependent methyltransferase [Acidobacteriota bacterium]
MSLGDPVTYSVRRQGLDLDLEAVAGTLNGRVLEIGCGRTGRRGRFRPPTDGISRWVYVDRDLWRSPNVCGNAGHLPIRSSVFDAIVCLEVLEYVWQPAAALAEIHRVLKPGGTLVLSTPFLHRVDAADDYWRFTEPALRRLLHESGFEVVRCLAQGSAFAVAASVLRSAVGVQSAGVRRVLSIVLRPFFAALRGVDSSSARRRPVLATFTTGYLIVARAVQYA